MCDHLRRPDRTQKLCEDEQMCRQRATHDLPPCKAGRKKCDKKAMREKRQQQTTICFRFLKGLHCMHRSCGNTISVSRYMGKRWTNIWFFMRSQGCDDTLYLWCCSILLRLFMNLLDTEARPAVAVILSYYTCKGRFDIWAALILQDTASARDTTKCPDIQYFFYACFSKKPHFRICFLQAWRWEAKNKQDNYNMYL